MFLNAVRGFCMALADSVPGVSGGTIAFLLGFYDEFINSLNDMIGKDNAKRKAALVFLIKLGIGWVIGFGASVMVLSSLFQVHIYEISSVIGADRRSPDASDYFRTERKVHQAVRGLRHSGQTAGAGRSLRRIHQDERHYGRGHRGDRRLRCKLER